MAITSSAFNPIGVIFLLALTVIFVGGVLAAFWIWGRPRRAPFACSKCGFDLRGSAGPGPVTCPECGTVYQ